MVTTENTPTLDQALHRLRDHMQIATYVSQWLRTSIMVKPPGTVWTDFQYHEVTGLQEYGMTVTDAMTQFGEDVARSVRDAGSDEHVLPWMNLMRYHETLSDGQRERHIVPILTDEVPAGVFREQHNREHVRYESLFDVLVDSPFDDALTIGMHTIHPSDLQECEVVLGWLSAQGRLHDTLTALARHVRKVMYRGDAVTAPFRLTIHETQVLVQTIILTAFLDIMVTVDTTDVPWSWREPLLVQELYERVTSEEFFTSIYRDMDTIYRECT